MRPWLLTSSEAGFGVLAAAEVAGEVELLVETTATVEGCRGCGVIAEAHGRRPVTVRDLPVGGRPVTVVWLKRLWCCPEPTCPVRTWSETSGQIRPRAVLTERACWWAMRRVGASVCRQLQIYYDSAADPLSYTVIRTAIDWARTGMLRPIPEPDLLALTGDALWEDHPDLDITDDGITTAIRRARIKLPGSKDAAVLITHPLPGHIRGYRAYAYPANGWCVERLTGIEPALSAWEVSPPVTATT